MKYLVIGSDCMGDMSHMTIEIVDSHKMFGNEFRKAVENKIWEKMGSNLSQVIVIEDSVVIDDWPI